MMVLRMTRPFDYATSLRTSCPSTAHFSKHPPRLLQLSPRRIVEGSKLPHLLHNARGLGEVVEDQQVGATLADVRDLVGRRQQEESSLEDLGVNSLLGYGRLDADLRLG